jgi:hypothetical protein
MADFEEINGKSIEEAFEEFDKANPEVYKVFCRFAEQWISKQLEAGKKLEDVRISAKQVCGRIRWWSSVEVEKTTDFRINDAFTCLYARKFLKDHPKYESVFELRTLRSSSAKLMLKFAH